MDAAHVFRRKVRAMLAVRGWSAVDLGRAIGVTPRSVNNKLIGDAEWKLSEIAAVVTALFRGDWNVAMSPTFTIEAPSDQPDDRASVRPGPRAKRTG